MNDKTTKAAKPAKNDVVFDLAALDTAKASEVGARVEMRHPVTKEGLGIFVTVLGKHGDTFREIVRDKANARVKQESMNARRGKPSEPRTAEQMEADALNLIVACTVSWDSGEGKDYITFEGEQLPFSHQNGLKVLGRLLWMREQVDNAIGDLENFIQA